MTILTIVDNFKKKVRKGLDYPNIICIFVKFTLCNSVKILKYGIKTQSD